MTHFIEHLLGVCGEAHLNIYHVLVVLVLLNIILQYRKRKV
jgi:hypothetical protein